MTGLKVSAKRAGTIKRLPISLFAMAALYILAGANHFRDPPFYRPLMPPYIPEPELMIALSGVCELGLGVLLLFNKTRRFAAVAIILMLIVFLSVHIYMFQERNGVFHAVSPWLIVARIPLQFVLIYWASTFARLSRENA